MKEMLLISRILVIICFLGCKQDLTKLTKGGNSFLDTVEMVDLEKKCDSAFRFVKIKRNYCRRGGEQFKEIKDIDISVQGIDNYFKIFFEDNGKIVLIENVISHESGDVNVDQLYYFNSTGKLCLIKKTQSLFDEEEHIVRFIKSIKVSNGLFVSSKSRTEFVDEFGRILPDEKYIHLFQDTNVVIASNDIEELQKFINNCK